jgi:hypothetical protein
MKRSLILLACIFAFATSFAQRPTAKKDQFANFLNSTMYVVTDNNPTSEYNEMIKECVRKSWRITKYDFIDQSEFESKRTDPNSSFLIVSEVKFPSEKNVATYDFISIILGGNYPSINEMPEVCTFPLNYTDAGDDNSVYKLPVIIGFFNQHIKNIQENPKLLKDKKYKFYTKQKKNIAKKTFYLVADEQLPDLNTAQKIRPSYSGKIVMIGQDELANLIRKRATNVVFLHKVGPSDPALLGTRCYIIVMGTDNTLYYFNYHKISASAPNGLTAKLWSVFASFVN